MNELLQGLEQQYIKYIYRQAGISNTLKDNFLNLLECDNSLERQVLWNNIRPSIEVKILGKFANPFYIGFGNPHSNILFVGKEKGFDMEKHPELFIKESINNTLQWKFLFDNFPNLNNINQVEIQNILGYNPIFPKTYHTQKIRERHTWGLYSKIVKGVTGLNHLLLNEDQNLNSSFFSRCFMTEINHIPSKYSNGLRMTNERQQFFKNNFYRNFTKVVIGAKGYLTNQELMELFEINNDGVEIILGENPQRVISMKKFIDNGRILVYCDQLSGAAGWTNEALDNLIDELND